MPQSPMCLQESCDLVGILTAVLTCLVDVYYNSGLKFTRAKHLNDLIIVKLCERPFHFCHDPPQHQQPILSRYLQYEIMSHIMHILF